MQHVARLVPELKTAIQDNNRSTALTKVDELSVRAQSSRQLVSDPVWSMATILPWIGPNFQAAREMAISADDVVQLGVAPLAQSYEALDWQNLITEQGINLQPLKAASPGLTSASHALRASSARLRGIDAGALIPALKTPLIEVRRELDTAGAGLEAASDAARMTPEMMGSAGARHYLLLVENNAEVRATGGIPGALAILSFDNGRMSLAGQSSAGALGTFSPVVPVNSDQTEIYSARLGKFMQDVNLTPDFPTAARTASSMWESRTGQRVDGVISLDPVALGYLLDGTGPVDSMNPEIAKIAQGKLPQKLNGQNVVKTLLSDVYSAIEEPEMQDAYFAFVAKEIFGALSKGQGNASGLIEGVTSSVQEGRLRLWSQAETEQSIIGKYALSGSISGVTVAPAEFGVYFNDGTGAKMDYYVKRTVQLVRACSKDGYEETTVRVISTNTAPNDAARSLPAYVTGDGNFGVPPGSVQTNIVAYGPAQSTVETAVIDGQKAPFSPHIHDGRPVGVVAVRLAPGESQTVEFKFGKIVQHAEPNLVVTPTVQPVKDVILPTANAACG
ncbi:DUF4012 domain-containing protein [Pseudarthrobacter equi]|nr:DUF4012 domain-containing protein [Pseudarthrobacter equi]